uniref:Uncharacterized protein n=1 Tax=Panagrolaimus sp. JU765 TaxID=591449 RepID=A0AC34QPB1_9BILA
MLQQYIDNQKNGDENAAKQFMTGFNSGQVKYFMPFISKRAGKEAMDQLKKEAKDKGFELPSALTDLDPETGKPAFLNASEKKIDEIIEKAQNEGKLSPTMMPTTTAIAIQASVYGDREIGQTQTELSWQFFEARMERGTEFEPHLAEKFGVDAGIEARPRMTTTAIQPEVSSIFQFWEENLKEKDEIEQQLENVVLARREASLEGDQTSEEATEIGLLRFLKSTGTQVQPE